MAENSWSFFAKAGYLGPVVNLQADQNTGTPEAPVWSPIANQDFFHLGWQPVGTGSADSVLALRDYNDESQEPLYNTQADGLGEDPETWLANQNADGWCIAKLYDQDSDPATFDATPKAGHRPQGGDFWNSSQQFEVIGHPSGPIEFSAKYGAGWSDVPPA